MTHVLRLHPREPAARDPVYRGDQFPFETDGAASQRRRFLVHQTYGVHRLVYVEAFERPDEAIAREKQLKRWKRDWKIELIERENLEWRDLSDLIV
jgi:hypothetical protein